MEENRQTNSKAKRERKKLIKIHEQNEIKANGFRFARRPNQSAQAKYLFQKFLDCKRFQNYILHYTDQMCAKGLRYYVRLFVMHFFCVMLVVFVARYKYLRLFSFSFSTP